MVHFGTVPSKHKLATLYWKKTDNLFVFRFDYLYSHLKIRPQASRFRLLTSGGAGGGGGETRQLRAYIHPTFNSLSAQGKWKTFSNCEC
jgi:hypothetical protein